MGNTRGGSLKGGRILKVMIFVDFLKVRVAE